MFKATNKQKSPLCIHHKFKRSQLLFRIEKILKQIRYYRGTALTAPLICSPGQERARSCRTVLGFIRTTSFTSAPAAVQQNPRSIVRMQLVWAGLLVVIFTAESIHVLFLLQPEPSSHALSWSAAKSPTCPTDPALPVEFERRIGASRPADVYLGGSQPNCRAARVPLRRHPAARRPLSQRKPQPSPSRTMDSRGHRLWSQLARTFKASRYLGTLLHSVSTTDV